MMSATSTKANTKEKSGETESKDPFFRLKNLAFRLVDPSSYEDLKFSDFVKFARLQVASQKQMLYHDPRFDALSDEEILIEYFAILFDKNEERREEFKSQLALPDQQEDEDWLEQMAAGEEGREPEEAPDEFDETPESLGE